MNLQTMICCALVISGVLLNPRDDYHATGPIPGVAYAIAQCVSCA